MDYRIIPKDGAKISTIGIGGAHLPNMREGETARLLEFALERGVNIIDLAVDGPAFPALGRALRGKRDEFMLGLHLGLTFTADGQYARSRDLGRVRGAFEEQLAQLGTDHAEIAYIHYVDEADDFKAVFESGVFDYALELRRQGRIRYLGFGSHRVDICRSFLATGEIDVFMFSINPAYDLDPVGNNPLDEDWRDFNALSIARERAELYRLAEKRGVGITVMKPFGAGRLLDARTSPFGRAMTIPQCLQYCLDRPAVVSCMLGVKSAAELNGALAYYASGRDERDYAFIAGMRREEMLGQCVYCNHCLPCPANIDIAAVHKFLDLALVGDELARGHYAALGHKAGDCVQCGSCEGNCPFQVPVRAKMRRAMELFGE